TTLRFAADSRSSCCRKKLFSSMAMFSSLVGVLHLIGRFDAEKFERRDELAFDEAAQLQEKLFLGEVAFRKDVMMVVEKIEGLGELKRVLSNESRLMRRDCGVDLSLERCSEERKFPERVSIRAG